MCFCHSDSGASAGFATAAYVLACLSMRAVFATRTSMTVQSNQATAQRITAPIKPTHLQRCAAGLQHRALHAVTGKPLNQRNTTARSSATRRAVAVQGAKRNTLPSGRRPGRRNPPTQPASPPSHPPMHQLLLAQMCCCGLPAPLATAADFAAAWPAAASCWLARCHSAAAQPRCCHYLAALLAAGLHLPRLPPRLPPPLLPPRPPHQHLCRSCE